MSNFKVRKDKWIEGILHVEEVIFHAFEEAVEHIKGEEHHGAKVIDHAGRVVHREGPRQGDTYA